MNKKIITQFWAGGRVPSRYLRFMDSIKKHNPSWQHRLLTETDAEQLSGMTWGQLKNVYSTYCSISNLVRLLAVYRDGGIYIDADCECVKPLDSLLEHKAFSGIVDNISIQGSANRICCAVFGAEPGHPWVKWQLDNRTKFDLKDSEWGVPLMTVAPRDGITLLPPEVFYPWHYQSEPDYTKVTPNTLICHHWDGDWRACQ